MYRGPTSWRDALATRLVFWFKSWLVPSLRLVVSILIIAYLGWCLLPPLVTHYLLHDDMVDIARRPLDDGETRRLIMEAIAKRGITKRLDPLGITLQTNPAGRKRNIGFSYQAELRLIPGRVHRFKLSIEVTEPVLFQPKTKHF